MNLPDPQTLFSPPSDPSLLATGFYDPWLVTLSVAVAVFASWMALQLTAQATEPRSAPLRAVALISGSLSLGAGIWTMHFIGMLAYRVCAVRYDPAITLWSLLPSIGASALALWLIGRRNIGARELLCGGVAVGAGIGAMHYTGMAALRMAPLLRFEPWTFALSILVAVVLAPVALWVRFGLRRARLHWTDPQRSLIAAVVMGVAISGMHYTGMAAARFVGRVPLGGATDADVIALALASSTILFALLVRLANGALRYREMYFGLQGREARLRALLSTAAEGVVIIDSGGRIEECNASAQKLFGRSREQLIGGDFSTLIAPPGALRSGDTLALRPDGTRLPIRLSVGHRTGNHPELLVAFVSDVSRRLVVERALRDREEQLRSLVSNLPGVTYRCLIEPGWPVLFISEAVEEVTGYPVSDFVGPAAKRKYHELIHPEDRARLGVLLAEKIARGQSYVHEYRLTHRDGTERYLWSSGRAVCDASGKPRYLDGMSLDITERHKVELELQADKERAEQAAAARAAFLANMSHEIRTPMNSILGFTDVLLLGPLSTEQRRHLETVGSSARSLLRLLNGVLDAAKLDKGLVELELRNFDLLELIEEIASTVGASARDKGLDLRVHYQRAMARRFRGDAMRIRQVLTNLVSNAVKFTHHGSIALEVARSDADVHFMIRDTGIGIAPDRLNAIFAPFAQGDASMTRRFGGTGLGTTISKQLVELMGGRIWVESTVGVGSCFHVRLPLPEAEGALEATRRQRRLTVLPPLHILAADDAPHNLELLTLLLGPLGHTVETAENGRTAVERCREQRFDVVLMDLHMPQMDGLAATRAIRAEEAARGAARVPIIALSASVLSEDRRAALGAGMDAFTTKPVELAELAFEMGRVLGAQDSSGEAPPPPPVARAPLLHSDRALQRWGGQREPWLGALRDFAAEHAQLPALMERLDASQARQLAHRARGVAANLGLDALAGLLADIERALGDASGASLPALRARLPELLRDSLAAIDRELARVPAPGSTSWQRRVEQIDAPRVKVLGDQLIEGFRRGEIDGAAFTELVRAFSGVVPQDRLRELRRAVDDFDFTRAQVHLRQVCAEIDADSGPHPAAVHS
jgi:PAS domain S-box-containing protein